jgi:hypothetical protein
MRKYASTSPDSRELVDELEFVWDQVKSNVSSSNSSSPVHTTQGLGLSTHATAAAESSTQQQSPPPAPPFSFLNRSLKRPGVSPQRKSQQNLHLSITSPLSQSQVDESSSEDGDAEEFVDAPDSQIADPRPPPHPTFSDDNKSVTSPQTQHPPEPPDEEVEKALVEKKKVAAATKRAPDARWRKRIEGALVKMTAEVAALREQLEARSWARGGRRATFERIARQFFSFLAKVIVFDLILLVGLLFWLRRKKDGRLEGAIRVLLGDAVAQVQKVGSGVQKQAQKGVGLVVGKIALGASTKKVGGRGTGPAASS